MSLEIKDRCSESDITSLDELSKKLTCEIKNGCKLNCMASILKRYKGDDWKKYVEYSDKSYNRKLVFKNELFDILIISWKKGQKSKIHDHPENGCIMTPLWGELVEMIYDNNNLELKSINTLQVGKIGYKEGSKLLHSVQSDAMDSVSIHIYSPCNYTANLYN